MARDGRLRAVKTGNLAAVLLHWFNIGQVGRAAWLPAVYQGYLPVVYWMRGFRIFVPNLRYDKRNNS